MLSTAFTLIRKSVTAFIDDGCIRMSAALAYYTIFALPGLLIVVTSIASLVFEVQSVEDEVIYQSQSLLGQDAAEVIRTVVNHAQSQTANISFASMFGLLGLLFGATGAFVELQTALNAIWQVKPDPERGNALQFIKKRMLSFGMILSIGFMLLVSLLLSTLLSMLGKQLNMFLPGFLSTSILQAFQFAVSFGIISLLFAAIFKVLPDAVVAWKDVVIGGVATALVFVIGKEFIGLYLGNSNVGSAFGAASSLAVLLVWVYFSAVLIFWGAEFTQAWIKQEGRRIKPGKGAIHTA